MLAGGSLMSRLARALAAAMFGFFVLSSASPAASTEPSATQPALDWVRHAAIPLATPEAGHGFDDMQPVHQIVGGARIVGMGEPTHGTREVFQMKHRMLEFLVTQEGFRVFGIEASMPDCA